MIGYVEAPKAWWLTHGMARVAGVSLPRAVTEGWLKRSELARLVSRCQGCACVVDPPPQCVTNEDCPASPQGPGVCVDNQCVNVQCVDDAQCGPCSTCRGCGSCTTTSA